jgi:hypothetical protein
MNAGSFRRLLAALIAVLAMAALASSASAKTEDIIAPSDPAHPTPTSGWQAGTCTKDTPTCTVATPEQFFEEASAHPQFIVRNKPGTVGPEEPIGELDSVQVDLPQGLSVNPQATVQCSQSQFDAEACPPTSKVGESIVTGSVLGLVSPVPLTATVFNIVPPQGSPARFGFKLAGNPIYLQASVATTSDYHEGFFIDVPELPIAGVLPGGLILKNRLVFNGRAGDGTFIRTPTTCFDWEKDPAINDIYSTFLLADSLDEAKQPGYKFPDSAFPRLESPLPPGTKPIDCAHVPYDPSTGADPNTALTDSPSGATTKVTVPHIKGGASRESSDTKEAQVALPEGLGLNPSASTGLLACTDAEFGKNSSAPVACPPASKVGIVEIETPPLPSSDGILKGSVFVGTQQSRDPASGDEYRIFVDAESARYGLSVRLVGRVSANPVTGQLTTRFQQLPQVPFSSFVVKLDGGPRAVLTSPATCGPHKVVSTMTPWTGNPAATPSGEFTLTSAPGGGACAKTLGERPFAPSFAASASSTQAASFTSLGIDVARGDGNQELKGVEVTLPPGMTAKLAGLRYCPEAAIQAAAAAAGAAEAASPNCPGDSLVGSAAITSGSGPQPLHIDSGKAYLAGPYKGAPLSLAVITPATAGPFDLGTVVVRVALFVDGKTAQVRTVTDPLPHVYGGTLLDLRAVSVKIDRPGFSLNGTNCTPSTFAAILHGGGANPNDPAAFSSVAASSPYAATGCDALPFGPKLFLRTFGATKRARNPKLRAILVARPGDANISRAAVTLPKSVILDQGAISKVCTRVQFTADQCPANSIYGFAEADTPLLDGPLKGPVYLRSSNNPLPDLVADLHGQVNIELSGRTDSVKGRIRNTFDTVPDVPVSRFVLTIRGGKKKGLLINSQNLCARKQFAKLDLTAQNGKRVTKKKLKVRTPCKKHKKKKRGAKGSR